MIVLLPLGNDLRDVMDRRDPGVLGHPRFTYPKVLIQTVLMTVVTAKGSLSHTWHLDGEQLYRESATLSKSGRFVIDRATRGLSRTFLARLGALGD